jgi:hypothetical protein
MRAALALCLLVSPATADTLMTPEEFEAWSTGQTLDYFIDGSFWGSEMHLPDRRTLDADAEGPCVEGRWYPRGDAICFTYDVSPGPHCWRFWRHQGTVLAELLDAPDAPMAEVALAPEPLACPGPDVGV